MQRSTEPVNERASVRAHDREIVETDEERRRSVKGKAHAIDDEGIPRRMVEGPSDGPLRIREREDGETARNQADQFQISRINKDNNTDVIPQTEGALANKSNETPERRKDQEEDDASMEDGEFNKMVDYYNELGMAEEMIDEDDMLDDIVVPDTQMMAVESENEQIEAIAQLRQKVISKDHTSNTRQNKDPPDQKQSTLPHDGIIEQNTPRGLLKGHEKTCVKK